MPRCYLYSYPSGKSSRNLPEASGMHVLKHLGQVEGQVGQVRQVGGEVGTTSWGTSWASWTRWKGSWGKSWRNWAPTCPYLSNLLSNDTTNNILNPSGKSSRNLPEASGTRENKQFATSFRQPFRKPSGTFRNCSENTNHETSFRQPFRKPSGTFRNCSRIENDRTSFRQPFRKPSGTFRNTGNSNIYLLEPTSCMQLVSNNKDNI